MNQYYSLSQNKVRVDLHSNGTDRVLIQVRCCPVATAPQAQSQHKVCVHLCGAETGRGNSFHHSVSSGRLQLLCALVQHIKGACTGKRCAVHHCLHGCTFKRTNLYKLSITTCADLSARHCARSGDWAQQVTAADVSHMHLISLTCTYNWNEAMQRLFHAFTAMRQCEHLHQD